MGKCILKILSCSLDVLGVFFFSVWRKCDPVTSTAVVAADLYDNKLNASKIGAL